MNLTGKIKDEFGNPLAGVTVELFEEGVGVAASSTVTNASGVWTFAAVDETKVWQVISTAAGSQKREVYTGNDVAVSELTVKDAIKVNGTVTLPTGAVTNTMLNADVGRENLLTNGGFEIWQRGAGAFTADAAYTADRWAISLGAASTISVTKAGVGIADTTTDAGSRYSAKVVYTHAAASSLRQKFTEDSATAEGVQGKTVSLSLRVKASVANAVRLAIFTWDGANAQTQYGSYHTGGGAWETLTVSLALDTDITSASVWIELGASGTFYMDNAMLVVGSVPADYKPLHPTDEMARCQRYYEVLGSSGGAPAVVLRNYTPNATEVSGQWLSFQTRKALIPTVTKVGTWSVSNCNQPTVQNPSEQGVELVMISTAGGMSCAYADTAGDSVTSEANP